MHEKLWNHSGEMASDSSLTGPRGFDEAAALSTVIRAPSCVIDFFEARDRLSAGFESSSEEFEIKRKAGNVAARQIPSVGRFDRLEESLYWLLSAATLIYLVLAVIG